MAIITPLPKFKRRSSPALLYAGGEEGGRKPVAVYEGKGRWEFSEGRCSDELSSDEAFVRLLFGKKTEGLRITSERGKGKKSPPSPSKGGETRAPNFSCIPGHIQSCAWKGNDVTGGEKRTRIGKIGGQCFPNPHWGGEGKRRNPAHDMRGKD